MNKAKKTFVVCIIIFFIAGCINSTVVDKSNGRQISAQKRGIFELSPSDADTLKEALLLLNNKEGEPAYHAAKAKLEVLIREYPQSKWGDSAKALVMTIDDLLNLQEKVKSQSVALDKESAEKIKLIKDYKYSEDRNRAEISRLQQENEQLKKDIALLKKLEIQLDKREKMLK